MKNLAELRKNLTEMIAEARSLNKESFAEGEKEKFDAKMTEIEELKALIEREERVQALEMDNPIIEDKANKPNEPETRGFKSLGEQLSAIIKACTPGTRSIDERLIETRAASGMGETVPADGGFFIQPDFASELLRDAYETGILASRVRRLPIGANSNGLKINGIDETSRADGYRSGGIQIYSAAEADTVTAKKPKFRQIELKLSKILGLCYLTDELIEDTTALESYVSELFIEEFGFKLDDYIMNGTGVGEPLGFMTSNAKITLTRDTTVTVKFADVNNMFARMKARSRANSIWLVNETQIEPALRTMTVTDYIPAYLPPGGLSVSPYGTLLGRPVIPIEQAPAIGTTGDIALVDLSKYLMIDKGGVQTASSLHVRFLYDEQVLRFVYRVDGQPMNYAPLTTKSGVTVSPFVVLSTK